MYDHNVPQCTTEHLRRVLAEIGPKPKGPQADLKARIDKELKRREVHGEAAIKTFRR